MGKTGTTGTWRGKLRVMQRVTSRARIERGHQGKKRTGKRRIRSLRRSGDHLPCTYNEEDVEWKERSTRQGRRKANLMLLTGIGMGTLAVQQAKADTLPTYQEALFSRIGEEDCVYEDKAAMYIDANVPEYYLDDVSAFHKKREKREKMKNTARDLKQAAISTAAVTTQVSTLGTAVVASHAATAAFLTAAENSVSACLSEAVTLPIDTAKVRLQLQGRATYVEGVVTRMKITPSPSMAENTKYKGTFQTMMMIAKEEGLPSLFNGLDAGIQHQLTYGGLRLALYAQFKEAFKTGALSNLSPLTSNIMAGLLSGAVAVIATNPVDVAKVRMQGSSISKATSWWQPYVDIAKEGGISGLWAGVTPNLARNSIINAVELAAFDSIHQQLEQIPTLTPTTMTLLAGMLAGVLAALTGSPMDVIRSQLMTSKRSKGSGGPSLLESVQDLYEEEGFGGFYRGIVPLMVRLAAFDMVLFLSLEKVRLVFEFLMENAPLKT